MNPVIHRQALRITLLDDCVFSARNATEGGHRSLSRIPGQALLGAAAARLYGALAARGDDAYIAFHSGRLRFLDGLPSDGDNIAYPVPLAWHRQKSGGDGRTAYNFARDKSELPNGAQPKQLREGYVFPQDGRHVEPVTTLRMKTAIDPKTGHAAEAQLFGYESLSRGQTFIAWVEADDAAGHLFDEIVEALQGEVLLGRSRSAEYGRVRIEKADRAETVQHGASDGKTLALWLLSDLALADRHGRPTLDPDPETLDLDGRIDWGHTFLRTRRYAPWNAYRHGYDRERLLLCAGGVISFTLNTPPGAHTLARLEAGIGLFREAGLGRVWIEPPLLAGKTHRLTRHKEPPRSHAPAPQHPLLAWLTERAADWRAPLDEHAKDLAGQIKDRLRAGRRRHGIGDAEDFGPSKSQWGRVLDTARAQSGKALHATLFAGDSAVIKPDGDGWSEIIDYHRDKPVRIASWLQEKLAPGPHRDNHYAYLIRRLAHLMRGDTARKGSKKGEPDNG